MTETTDEFPGGAPSGEEREVVQRSGVAVDGAPLAYVVALAGVVMALTVVAIPITFVLGTGKNFPMSQGVYPLVGWLLGPIAGAVADGVGALGGVLINPQNTSNLVGTVLGAALGGAAAGTMGGEGRRRHAWIPLAALFAASYALYAGRAVLVNRADGRAVLAGTFINGSALLLYALPTRRFFARCIASDEGQTRAVGLFGGTWIGAGLTHLVTGTIVYWQVNWANAWWWPIAAAAPFEHVVRCLIGTTVGLGVIAGLRALDLVKPSHARY
jgi:predicted membrane protein